MHVRPRMVILASLVSVGLSAHAQVPHATLPAAPPTNKADVGQWDVGIVQRAEEILASPAQWNRADTGKCPANARTFSIRCALQKAVEEAAGVRRDQGRGATVELPARSDCRLHAAEDHQRVRAGRCSMRSRSSRSHASRRSRAVYGAKAFSPTRCGLAR